MMQNALLQDHGLNPGTTDRLGLNNRILKIDLTGATDVSGVASLPAGALPIGTVPVSKTLFIDLLDPVFNLVPTIPEKIEGLAWGPDLEDGRHVLYVISDNDLNPSLATQIYAFAIDPSLVNLQPQTLPGPLYPPGQVKKELRSQ
jgi:Esterase-like activity of phytase